MSGWLPVVRWQIGGQDVVVLGFAVGLGRERELESAGLVAWVRLVGKGQKKETRKGRLGRAGRWWRDG